MMSFKLGSLLFTITAIVVLMTLTGCPTGGEDNGDIALNKLPKVGRKLPGSLAIDDTNQHHESIIDRAIPPDTTPIIPGDLGEVKGYLYQTMNDIAPYRGTEILFSVIQQFWLDLSSDFERNKIYTLGTFSEYLDVAFPDYDSMTPDMKDDFLPKLGTSFGQLYTTGSSSNFTIYFSTTDFVNPLNEAGISITFEEAVAKLVIRKSGDVITSYDYYFGSAFQDIYADENSFIRYDKQMGMEKQEVSRSYRDGDTVYSCSSFNFPGDSMYDIFFVYGDDTMGGIANFSLSSASNFQANCDMYLFDYYDANGNLVSQAQTDTIGGGNPLLSEEPVSTPFLAGFEEFNYFASKHLATTTGNGSYIYRADDLVAGLDMTTPYYDAYVVQDDNTTDDMYYTNIGYLVDTPFFEYDPLTEEWTGVDVYLLSPFAAESDRYTFNKQNIVDGVKSEIQAFVNEYTASIGSTSGTLGSMLYSDYADSMLTTQQRDDIKNLFP
jgi:hypothetical protein